MLFLALIHRDEEPGFGISFPDFPGCISEGATIDEAVRCGATALAFHIEGMIQDGETIPAPRSLEEIERDPSLAEWREGAVICSVPAVIDKGAQRRVRISLDYGLLQTIDDEAKRRGMTRSAFLSSAARNEIQERNLDR